jgi:hypothetical protein
MMGTASQNDVIWTNKGVFFLLLASKRFITPKPFSPNWTKRCDLV